MVHILFISRNYLPEKAAAAVRVSEIAKRLVKRGHQVTVLTTVPNYPDGIVSTKYRGCLIYEDVLDDVRVLRVWSYTSPNKGFLRRIFAMLSFGCISPFLAYKTIDHPDIVIVTTPLFNVIAARMLAWMKKCPLIFWVADLWPESAIQLGMLRNRLLIRLSEWLEWSTYRCASTVWVVTEGLREILLHRGVPQKKLLLITNGVDTIRFRPLPRAQARAELGWDDRFTLLYAGNHGLVYAFSTLLDAAQQLINDPTFHLILAGDGVKKAELMAEARKRDLKNVTFLDAVAYEDMPRLWAAADLCLIPLRNIPLVESSLPVKMFEMMACARPFVLGAEGVARNLAEREANAGIVVEPENVEALVSAILYLHAHPEEAEAAGARGREYVELHFDYERLTAMLEAHLEILLKKPVMMTIPKKTPVFTSDVPGRV